MSTVDIKNISSDERAVAYGVVNPPQLVKPGQVVAIYDWALPAYENQKTIWEVIVPVNTEPVEEAGEGGDTIAG